MLSISVRSKDETAKDGAMAKRLTGVSLPPEANERLRAEAAATGLKLSTIMLQALRARWEAQDQDSKAA